MSRVKYVPLKDITTDFFVRTTTNDDHVFALAQLVEAGVEMTPIIITPDNRVIDGRHRMKAYDLAGKKEIPCEVRANLSKADEMLLAISANMGGSLPPTATDIRTAIANMLQAGIKPSQIEKGLPQLPKSVCRRYINDAYANIAKRKLNEALSAMSEGNLSAKAVAEKYDVDLATLQAKIKGKRKKDTAQGPAKYKSVISSHYRSLSQKNRVMCEKLLDAYTDGELSSSGVESVIDTLEKSIKQQLSNLGSWRLRYEAARRLHSSGQAA